jgi:hypothetical protein
VNPASVAATVRHYHDTGLVDIRHGMTGTDEDVLATFEAKWNMLPGAAAGHYNYDPGHFTLFGYGGRFAVDNGYGHNYSCTNAAVALYSGCEVGGNSATYNGWSSGHNVVLVDDDHRTHRGFDRSSSFPAIRAFVDAPAMTLIRSDLREAFASVQHARRDVLFTRGSNEPVILAVADAVQKSTAPVSYQWQMHTGTGHVIVPNGPNFSISAPSGARLTGVVSATSPRRTIARPHRLPQVDPLDSVHDLVQSVDAGASTALRLDHLAVMALTRSGAATSTMDALAATGGNVVHVAFPSGRGAYVASKAVGAPRVTSSTVFDTDAEFAKVTFGLGETAMANGTELRTDARPYVEVSSGPATVVASGARIHAEGPVGASYRVYAPQAITAVTVNGAASAFSRSGDYITFG